MSRRACGPRLTSRPNPMWRRNAPRKRAPEPRTGRASRPGPTKRAPRQHDCPAAERQPHAPPGQAEFSPSLLRWQQAIGPARGSPLPTPQPGQPEPTGGTAPPRLVRQCRCRLVVTALVLATFRPSASGRSDDRDRSVSDAQRALLWRRAEPAGHSSSRCPEFYRWCARSVCVDGGRGRSFISLVT